MSNDTRATVFFAAIGLAVLALPGCESPGAPQREAPEVTVAKPEQRENVTDFAEFTGTTKSVQTLDVRARVQGELRSVKAYTEALENQKARAEKREPDKSKIVDDFTEGTVVPKGRLLFVIEPEPYQAKLAQAEARLKQSEAKRDLARANFERSQRLFEKGTITKQEHDTRTAELNASEADVLRAQADVRQAQIDLGYTEIRAPFEGRIGRRLVDIGNLVGAGDATLLTTIERTGPMYAYFDVNERVVNRIQRWRKEREGKADPHAQFPVELGLTDEKGYPHKGFLDFVDNAIDPGTGTALVRGVFPNKDGLITPGAFVRLRVAGPPIPNALLVHEEAICTDLEGKYLWIVDGEKVAHTSHVERGPLIDGMRVILKGIGPEDRYVWKGVQHVRNKMPVRPVEAKQEEAAPSAPPEPAPAAKPAE